MISIKHIKNQVENRGIKLKGQQKIQKLISDSFFEATDFPRYHQKKFAVV